MEMTMGCDIHMCIEAKPWADRSWEPMMMEDACYDTRNYDLFSWLANVRNYGEKSITPLAEPRGLPPDVSDFVKRHFDAWGPDCHSHSWLLVSEVLGANHPDGAERFLRWLRPLVSHDEKGNWVTALQDLPHDAIRLVFAFDN
jgi:hypothetical protein